MENNDAFDLFALPLERPFEDFHQLLDVETGLPGSWARILEEK